MQLWVGYSILCEGLSFSICETLAIPFTWKYGSVKGCNAQGEIDHYVNREIWEYGTCSWTIAWNRPCIFLFFPASCPHFQLATITLVVGLLHITDLLTYSYHTIKHIIKRNLLSHHKEMVKWNFLKIYYFENFPRCPFRGDRPNSYISFHILQQYYY
jgi:hypothetical protein